jgi:geranylgeranyl pyrophosphate synthase
MKELALKKFEEKDAQYLNQFLRGEVYIVMDWILTTQSSIRESTEIKLAQDLMETYINLFVKYLEVLPETLKDVKNSEN